ncbi:MAG TPA: response regulator [Polyangiaceae bacterium LLY-WYZ-15_(1-7)]|nr:hypothetical protein [Myxococcales bacterium]MAT23953.1 hypothetical protein [Sandaracinus sp.]HJL00579.1 response regulator [Polyangiaceae bacterium LLY-WYZ-15_(1-7)]MBJ71611.1 hypothetical protein [Sandaracinus sp.]HJL06921.1 response regulator [Polyangiaceae bacterium LLY-WYZ-15_(1-7)]
MSRRLLLVDDHPGTGKAFASALRDWSITHVGDADTARLLLEDEGPWNVVFLDVHLGGEIDGLELLQERAGEHPETTFSLLTGDGSPDIVETARRLGASYMRKPVDVGVLRAWLAQLDDPPSAPAEAPSPRAAIGAEEVATARARALVRFAEERGLTTTQRDVLRLAIEGHTRTQIAKALGVTLSTYQKHVRAIRDRTGMRLMQCALKVLREPLE